MSEITIFIISIIILLITVFIIFLIPLFLRIKKVDNNNNVRRQINKLIIKDQLEELETEKNNQLISEEEYQKTFSEIESRANEDLMSSEGVVVFNKSPRFTLNIFALLVIISACATGLYFVWGTPQAITYTVNASPLENPVKQMEDLLITLEKKLAEKPNNPEGWLLLARSYKSINKMDLAVQAYQKLIEINPDSVNKDGQTLTEYADALAAVQKSFEGRPNELLLQALKLDSENVMTLWLLGSAQMNNKNYSQALKYWLKLRSLLEVGSEDRKVIQGVIDETVSLGNFPANPDDGKFTGKIVENITQAKVNNGALKPQSAEDTTNVNPQINQPILLSGAFEIDNSVTQNLKPNLKLLIIVRPVGERMPIATKIMPIDENNKSPIEFKLDNTNSMIAENSLDKYTEVTIEGRITPKVMAGMQVGDMFSGLQKAQVGQSGIKITINQIQK